MNWMMDGTFMLGACLVMFIGIALIIAISGYVIRNILKSRVEDVPLKILNELFVRGEIEEAEYKHKYNIIKNKK